MVKSKESNGVVNIDWRKKKRKNGVS